MKLTRSLVTFDVESTGLDVATDRIISLALSIERPGSNKPPQEHSWKFNPGRTLDPKIVELTGITDEELAECPAFDGDLATFIHGALIGVDLMGFNLINFDVPILWEEFNRAGINWDLEGINIIDVGNIYKKKEPRTLSAALNYYCNEELTDAHEAMADVRATAKVARRQLFKYQDLLSMTTEELAEFSHMDDRVDLAGKIVRNDDGVPCYNIGKSKGVPVKDDPGFGYWMLSKDFSEQTKAVLQRILNEPEPQPTKEENTNQGQKDVPF